MEAASEQGASEAEATAEAPEAEEAPAGAGKGGEKFTPVAGLLVQPEDLLFHIHSIFSCHFIEKEQTV